MGLPGTHKHIYLGLFCEEAEAARAYDRSMVRLHGSGAATNFPLSDYTGDMADHHLMQKVRLDWCLQQKISQALVHQLSIIC